MCDVCTDVMFLDGSLDIPDVNALFACVSFENGSEIVDGDNERRNADMKLQMRYLLNVQ